MTEKKELKPLSQPDAGDSRLKRIAAIAFFVLLVGVFAVVVILPARVARNRDQAPAPAGKASVKPDEGPDEVSEAKAEEARELMNSALKLQARLENDGVNVWGSEKIRTSYGEVSALLSEANESFDSRRYEEALAGYRQAIEQLRQLEAGRPERARRAMEQGGEAFARLDSKAAIQQYAIAVAADPGSSKAQAGLKRAENLEQVLGLIAEGEAHERNGRLVLARTMYNEAVLLDKEFQPAWDHFQRIDKVISGRDFLQSMSEAESALGREDIQQAKAALEQARDLQPDSLGVRDLDGQLKNIELRVEFQELSRQALQYEMAEEWEKAAGAYDSVLNKDANAQFAREGKNRVENIIELNRAIQKYMGNPDALQEPEHASHARQIVALAVAQGDVGPKFRAQTEELNDLIVKYGEPVPVLIRSDNLTDVRIYRVSQFGPFLEHRLTLLPGSYKAVGIRSGYRDVSVPFTVPLGSQEIIIDVFCEEKI